VRVEAIKFAALHQAGQRVVDGLFEFAIVAPEHNGARFDRNIVSADDELPSVGLRRVHQRSVQAHRVDRHHPGSAVEGLAQRRILGGGPATLTTTAPCRPTSDRQAAMRRIRPGFFIAASSLWAPAAAADRPLVAKSPGV